MRTTLNLPDDLFRTVKVMAAQQNRTLQAVIAELLRKGLACEEPGVEQVKVTLPLISCAQCSHDVTPEFVAELLIDQEADDSL